jgi:kynurenine formamidase
MEDRTSGIDMEALFESVKNWGRWGSEDQRGALNLITETEVANAARTVRAGIIVSCALDLPVIPSVENPTPAQHMMIIAGDHLDATGVPGLETALDFVGVACHGMAVTHIDAFCHVFVKGEMYNGRSAREVRSTGATSNSIESTFPGIVGRGLLLDIPRIRGVDWLEPGEAISVDELTAAETRQGVKVQPGDILLVRTGRAARRAALGPWDPNSVGLAGLQPLCASWIHERGVAVLGSDGVSDPLPGNPGSWPIPLHQCCLVAMGVHLIDNMELDTLAAVCEREGRFEFQLTVAPLRIRAATGSAVNPIAIL